MYRFGNRNQIDFLPPTIDQFVAADDPVRAYDAFVDQLNLADLGIQLNPKKAGCPEFDPVSMFKLLLYGYSYGIRSSRKLEQATHHNLSFIYLMGNLKPDHKTIARFRRNNRDALKKMLKQCVRMCIKMDLIDGNTLFVDGTKIRGNASIRNSWSQERCLEALKRADQQIEAILAECEAADEAEKDQESYVKMKGELTDKEILKKKVQAILAELEASEKKSHNTVDGDCTKFNGIQGAHAGYNMQSVVDDKHGLIVHNDIVAQSNDANQFSSQVKQAQEMLEKKCKTACGDAGYSDVEELKKVKDEQINVVVPSSGQVAGKEHSPFDKRAFRYDSKGDCYVCPANQVLRFCWVDRSRNRREYQIENPSLCQRCCHFGSCTSSTRGRRVKRMVLEDVKEEMEANYLIASNQDIYKRRKEKIEHPFGHFKRNLKFDAFLLRGFKGALAEGALISTCFNLRRIMTIFGVQGFLGRLSSA